MASRKGDEGSGGGLELWLLHGESEPTSALPAGIGRRLAQWVSWLVAGAAPAEFDRSGGDESSGKAGGSS